MKNITSLFILLIIYNNSFAAAEFFCFGEEYTVGFIVSHAPDEKDKVAEVHISGKGQMLGMDLKGYSFVANNLSWPDKEGDYSANSLIVKLVNTGTKDEINIQASGIVGILEMKGTKYALECEWEG